MPGAITRLFMALCLFPSMYLSAQSVIFSSESLQFVLEDSICHMSGTYVFKNTSDQSTTTKLLYPFYLDEGFDYPFFYEVKAGEQDQPLQISTHPRGLSFWLEIEPNASKKIWVRYSQKAPNGNFTYILTSTQAWKRPLDHAAYEIKVPLGLELQDCSLAVDSTKSFPAFLLYRIERDNYLPSRDLKIKWGKQS